MADCRLSDDDVHWVRLSRKRAENCRGRAMDLVFHLSRFLMIGIVTAVGYLLASGLKDSIGTFFSLTP